MALVFFQPVSMQAEELAFAIKGYMVEGNSILTEEEITFVLQPYTGPEKTSETVNQARDALERFYHHQGYPTVIVNIPLQTLDSDMVKLQVMESKIGKVRVTGNKYFTMKRLRRSLPAILTGRILYLPQFERELNRLNRNRHIKVAPVLSPGKEYGTIDVELKVKDKLPFHGSVELNNYAGHNTTDLRSSIKLTYDNFWQRDHSLSLQFQTSPQDMEEVCVFAGSYLMGSWLNPDHLTAIYGVVSDSETSLVELGSLMNMVSKGNILGLRYIIPLTPRGDYYHSLTLGIDYKDFDDTTDFSSSQSEASPSEGDAGSGITTAGDDESADESTKDVKAIDYLPLSIDYSGNFSDPWGQNRFSLGITTALRGIVSHQEEFDEKRPTALQAASGEKVIGKARADFMIFTSSISREQKLWDYGAIYGKINIQQANMPLIANEQFYAGGVNSVRGYKESEVTGDSGMSGTMEIRLPDGGPVVENRLHSGVSLSLQPYLFYEAATLSVKQPSAGQKSGFTLQGIGGGIRGHISRFFHYQLDVGCPLVRTDDTGSGDLRFYFKVSGEF